MQKAFGFVLGIVAGALVGGVVTLLITPTSGDELIGQIRGRSLGFVDEVKDAAEAKRIELEQRLAALRAPRSS